MMRIYEGHAFDVLCTLAADSVQCVVTSPPYFGLRSYGTPPVVWPDGWQGHLGLEPTHLLYLQHLVAIFGEVRRVLRPDGVCWVNIGDSYARDALKGGNGSNGKQDDMPNDGAARRLRSEAQGSSDGFVGRADRAPVRVGAGVPAKNLLLIPQRLAIALQDAGWIVRQVFPWVKRNCLGGGTWVYARTQKGDMPMTIKDMARLRPETVQLWNGTRWTQVLDVQQHVPPPERSHLAQKHAAARREGQDMLFPPAYLEIGLQNGEKIGCTADHRWPTQRGLLHASELQVGDILESTTLPEPMPLRSPGMLDDEMIGWFVGLYLAEGHIDEHRIIHIAGHIAETNQRQKKLQELVDAFDGRLRVQRPEGKKQNIALSGKILPAILDTYIVGNSALNKHLTTAAWQRSNAFLSAVLLGYLEGDGSWEAQSNRWRLGFGNNDRLAGDLRTLGARLNVSVRLRRSRVSASKGGALHKIWRGTVRFEWNDTSQWTQFTRIPDTQIVSIRQDNGRQYWDIAVADEPHLFALASGLLTHNSMPGSQTDRATTALEWWLMLTKSARYFCDMEAVRQTCSLTSHGSPHINPGTKQLVVNQPHGTLGRWTVEDKHNGRTYRNTDLWLQSLNAPYGLVGVGDELVGLDVPTQGYAGDHYATFSVDLIEPLLRMGTSAHGACSVCGAPWERMVQRTGHIAPLHEQTPKQVQKVALGYHDVSTGLHNKGWRKHPPPTRTTQRWAPTCLHTDAPRVPCVVLDPFMGRATTLLAAQRLGLHGIGIELNPQDIGQASARLRADAPLLAQVQVVQEAQRHAPL